MTAVGLKCQDQKSHTLSQSSKSSYFRLVISCNSDVAVVSLENSIVSPLWIDVFTNLRLVLSPHWPFKPSSNHIKRSFSTVNSSKMFWTARRLLMCKVHERVGFPTSIYRIVTSLGKIHFAPMKQQSTFMSSHDMCWLSGKQKFISHSYQRLLNGYFSNTTARNFPAKLGSWIGYCYYL